jgi:hypothetical protein
MNSKFTDRFSLKKNGKKESSLKRRLEAYGIKVRFKEDIVNLRTEKPLSIDEWQEILNKI